MTVSRTVKGKRPVFVSGDTDANLNRLLTMISALTAEVAVLRDRHRTMEKLLARKDYLSLDEIERYQPDPEDLAERMEWQAQFLRRVHYVFEREAEETTQAVQTGTDG